MSDEPITIPLDPEDVEPSDEQEAQPTPRVLGSSVLDQITREVREAKEDDDKILPVNRKIPRLYARYRALDDDEQEGMTAAVQHRAKLRKRVGKHADLEGETEGAAALIATACVELLWENDTWSKPEDRFSTLADQIGVPGPLRFSRQVAQILGLTDELGDDATSDDVAAKLHRIGESNEPLRATARLLGLWMGGLSVESISEALEGN